MAGTIVAGTISDGVDTGNVKDSIHGSAKAWVHFDAVNNVVMKAYNVSSLTDRGVGLFRVNFANPFLDNLYAFVGTAKNQDVGATDMIVVGQKSIDTTYSNTGFDVSLMNGNTYFDSTILNLVVFH